MPYGMTPSVRHRAIEVLYYYYYVIVILHISMEPVLIFMSAWNHCNSSCRHGTIVILHVGMEPVLFSMSASMEPL